MNTTNTTPIMPDQAGQLLLTGGNAGRAAESFAQGLVDAYPAAMAAGRGGVWAAAAHSIIDLLATAPALQLTSRATLDTRDGVIGSC